MADAWFVGKGGGRSGPFSTDVLRDMAASGRLAPTDLVWREGMAAWAAATTVAGLFTPSRPPAAPSPHENPYSAPTPGNDVHAPPSGAAAALGSVSRPYSFSAVVALAAQAFRNNWIILFLIGLVLIGVGIAVSIPQWIAQAVGLSSGDEGVLQFMTAAGSLIGFALNLLVSAHFFAGSVVAAANATLGLGRMGDVLLGFKRYGTVLLTALLVFLISLAVLCVAYLPMILGLIVAFATRGADGEISNSGGAVMGVTFLATFVLMILGFAMVIIRVSFAPAIAADPEHGGSGAIDAIRLNWRRTSIGTGFSLLGLLIIVGLIMFVSVLLLCVGCFLLGLSIAIAAAGAAYQLLFRGDRAGPSAR